MIIIFRFIMLSALCWNTLLASTNEKDVGLDVVIPKFVIRDVKVAKLLDYVRLQPEYKNALKGDFKGLVCHGKPLALDPISVEFEQASMRDVLCQLGKMMGYSPVFVQGTLNLYRSEIVKIKVYKTPRLREFCGLGKTKKLDKSQLMKLCKKFDFEIKDDEIFDQKKHFVVTLSRRNAEALKNLVSFIDISTSPDDVKDVGIFDE